MSQEGYLSKYFSGVAAKRLSEVEANASVSNQHEFNGVKILHELFGRQRKNFNAKFIYLDDGSFQPVAEDGSLTWYDSRENNPHRSEYRLYYSKNQALKQASAGDLLIVARCQDDTVLVIVAQQGSTIERQLLWLFGLSDLALDGFVVPLDIERASEDSQVSARFILEQIGIVPEDNVGKHLEIMLQRFNGSFPPTKCFSDYARETLPDVSGYDDPDAALDAWMRQEESLFYALEKHLLSRRIREMVMRGEEEPEPYIKVAQSALQRRKSRAGQAMENHLEQIFKDWGVSYTRGGATEGRSKPDFVFPCISSYRNANFPDNKLFMLAVKTTCKDRWRQILNEAARIKCKHLATMEPAISIHQTNEMKNAHVTLVIPEKTHASFLPAQRKLLCTVRGFVDKMSFEQSLR